MDYYTSSDLPLQPSVRLTLNFIQFLHIYWMLEMQNLTLFISCKSDHRRLSFGCVKSLESTDMSCSIENRPVVLYKQAKVSLDSLRLIKMWGVFAMWGGGVREFFQSVPPEDFKWNSPKAAPYCRKSLSCCVSESHSRA